MKTNLPSIKRAAVIGSGVMGSAVAAHLTNAGIPTVLLDIVPPEGSDIGGDPDTREYRNALAAAGLSRAVKSRPAAFYTTAKARLITIGNLEDDLDLLRDVDWVVEAVVEKLEIKQQLFERIAPFLKDTVVLTTNTSGLSVTDMAGVLPAGLAPRFLGTHFFNPPRYLKLLELIPHAGTDGSILEAMGNFGEEVLGKGVVVAKDTPDFIANRIGTFSVMCTLRAMLEGGYTIEEADALTGPLIGRAKSATFRTADLVGLDILLGAAQTVYDRATDDEERAVFLPPNFIVEMFKRGMLGAKTGAGFYKKVKKDGESEILTIDPNTLDYRARQKARFGSVDAARAQDDPAERIRAVLAGKDRGAEFVWRVLSETIVYAANRLGEIADNIVAVDEAMRWGFGWAHGPFELWDVVGVERAAERLAADGREVPAVVTDVLSTPAKSFYYRDDSQARHFFVKGEHAQLAPRAKTVDLEALRAGGHVVKKNSGASLVDVGEGVLCLEFHSKMNAIGPDIIAMMLSAVAETESNFDALVIANNGDNFSVGANLMLMLLEAQDGNWEEIDLMVRQFQKATMALKYCRRPVVAAPFGMTLGGGCEVALGAGHVHAAAETYIGLVEVGVGLIPAGGGCKEMLLRNLECMPPIDGADVFPFTRAAFEAIGLAKVSTSADHAKELRIFRPGDPVTLNRDRLLFAARATAKALYDSGYRPPDPARQVPVAGESGIATIKTQLYNMKEGGFISEYDAYLGGELARVLCGGEVPAGTTVTEQYLLDLEREVFLRLTGQKKTLERMQHMLKKGKPLRN